MNVHFSSAKDDWCTPPEVLKRVRKVGPIGLDPCCNRTDIKHVRPKAAFVNPDREQKTIGFLDVDDRDADGLAEPWSGYGLVYVNPPYGRRIGKWVDKCREADECIALLPARTDTKWFPWDADALAFWKGRVKFWQPLHAWRRIVAAYYPQNRNTGLPEIRSAGDVYVSPHAGPFFRSAKGILSVGCPVVRADMPAAPVVGPWDPAPFPSVVAYWAPKASALPFNRRAHVELGFRDAFSDVAHVVVP